MHPEQHSHAYGGHSDILAHSTRGQQWGLFLVSRTYANKLKAVSEDQTCRIIAAQMHEMTMGLVKFTLKQ